MNESSESASNIVVIEDDPSISQSLIYALSSEGFIVRHFTNGRTAIDNLKNNHADCILLDVGLPDMSGFDVCKSIRSFSDVPVLFLTARSEEIDKILGLELGADDYIAKPFSPREVTARVRAVLRRSIAATSKDRNPINNFPFIINDLKKEILYFGTTLTLSKSEFLLLKHLIKSPGRIYSREQLMQATWEDPYASTERTVDTHIKTIRRYLKNVSSDHEAIITHRGFGYSLKDNW